MPIAEFKDLRSVTAARVAKKRPAGAALWTSGDYKITRKSDRKALVVLVYLKHQILQVATEWFKEDRDPTAAKCMIVIAEDL
eukprot:4132957-Alexandrium_andersonii.AAC.1